MTVLAARASCIVIARAAEYPVLVTSMPEAIQLTLL